MCTPDSCTNLETKSFLLMLRQIRRKVRMFSYELRHWEPCTWRVSIRWHTTGRKGAIRCRVVEWIDTPRKFRSSSIMLLVFRKTYGLRNKTNRAKGRGFLSLFRLWFEPKLITIAYSRKGILWKISDAGFFLLSLFSRGKHFLCLFTLLIFDIKYGFCMRVYIRHEKVMIFLPFKNM